MRIQKLTLQCNDAGALKAFYGETLGLYIHYQDKHSFELLTGPTTVRFVENTALQKPYYHFAWNIPANLCEEAATWIKEKNIQLLTEPGTTNEILDFIDWNAHAIYFYDPAGNIVELIARHNLDNNSSTVFDADGFLEISEIGVVAKDDDKAYHYITEELHVPFWKGNRKDFNALGDEHGLFITVPEGRQWFMSEKHAECFPLEINFTVEELHQTIQFRA